MTVLGWRCAVCGATVDVAAVHPFRCPRSTPSIGTTCCTR